MDLSEAFACLVHDFLLAMLEPYCLIHEFLKLINSYLIDKKHAAKRNYHTAHLYTY